MNNNQAAKLPSCQAAKILITGANGMLGQDLCPILEENGYEVIKTDIDNLDITNFDMVNSVISSAKPDVVIHCAAYTNVDKAESDYPTAHKINAVGTENIAKVCAQNDIPILYISTDYVFNGEGKKPYKTNAKTDPINKYGLTKLEGEQAVQKYCKKYYICRTSWLYGIHGKCFVETMLSFATDKVFTQRNSTLKVVEDQIGCPTWTVELANAIVKVLKKKKYGIYHTCCSGETSWYNFAKKIFELAGIDMKLRPCSSDDFPRPAKRPAYSVMSNSGLCRDWLVAITDYMNKYHK